MLFILISTHSAREDGDHIGRGVNALYVISTHSAREDGDAVDKCKDDSAKFISTHSAREDGDCNIRIFGRR